MINQDVMYIHSSYAIVKGKDSNIDRLVAEGWLPLGYPEEDNIQDKWFERGATYQLVIHPDNVVKQ
jgi:hypothetical protein